MTGFYFVCGALILSSGLFYLFPRVRTGGVDRDLQRANLDWYEQRQAELSADGEVADLQEDARLRLLEDEQLTAAVDMAEGADDKRFPLWPLLPLFALAAAGIYYKLGAATDVMIARQLQGLGESATSEEIAELIGTVQSRSAQRPDNLHYLALLGRYYMGQEDYASAARVYEELAEKAPEDAQSLAYAAQARYLAAGRNLSDTARLRAEQALAIDPHQRTALGLLGMTSFEQGKYRAAIDYWERLLVMEPADSESARMIAGVIDSARQKLGEPTVAPEPVEDSGVGITVNVSLPNGAAVAPDATVFVLARNAESESRMPIAVQRRRAAELPLSLRLDDNNSMAGQKLSAVSSVLVLVQVSPEGRPGEANATWLGQAGPLTPGRETGPLEIVLTPRDS